jgi:hypothetical protein
MAYRPAANGKPKLPQILEAQLIVKASELGMTGTDALVDAAQRWITWADKTANVRRYKAAVAEAEKHNRVIRPMPADYGLPPDYGIPKL